MTTTQALTESEILDIAYDLAFRAATIAYANGHEAWAAKNFAIAAVNADPRTTSLTAGTVAARCDTHGQAVAAWQAAS